MNEAKGVLVGVSVRAIFTAPGRWTPMTAYILIKIIECRERVCPLARGHPRQGIYKLK